MVVELWWFRYTCFEVILVTSVQVFSCISRCCWVLQIYLHFPGKTVQKNVLVIKFELGIQWTSSLWFSPIRIYWVFLFTFLVWSDTVESIYTKPLLILYQLIHKLYFRCCWYQVFLIYHYFKLNFIIRFWFTGL